MRAGTVASRPVAIGGGGALEASLRSATVLLAVITVLVTPALFAMLVMFFLFFLVIGWFLGRIGMLWPLMLMGRRGGGGGPSPQPTMAFRWDTGDRISQVHLLGHETGVALGDTVAVRGPRIGGIFHASSVVNYTTGVVLRRRGMYRLIALVLVDLWLLLGILSVLAAPR